MVVFPILAPGFTAVPRGSAQGSYRSCCARPIRAYSLCSKRLTHPGSGYRRAARYCGCAAPRFQRWLASGGANGEHPANLCGASPGSLTSSAPDEEHSPGPHGLVAASAAAGSANESYRRRTRGPDTPNYVVKGWGLCRTFALLLARAEGTDDVKDFSKFAFERADHRRSVCRITVHPGPFAVRPVPLKVVSSVVIQLDYPARG